MANIDKAIKEDVELNVELKILQNNADLEAKGQELVYYFDMDTYAYEFNERTLNEYQKNDNLNKILHFKGFQNKEHLKTRTRAIFGCVNSLLFVVSAILGIVAGKIGTRTHRFFALVASVAAGLFCWLGGV